MHEVVQENTQRWRSHSKLRNTNRKAERGKETHAEYENVHLEQQEENQHSGKMQATRGKVSWSRECSQHPDYRKVK